MTMVDTVELVAELPVKDGFHLQSFDLEMVEVVLEESVELGTITLATVEPKGIILSDDELLEEQDDEDDDCEQYTGCDRSGGVMGE